MVPYLAMSYKHTSDAMTSALIQLMLAEHPTLLHADEIRRELVDDTDTFTNDVDDALAHLRRTGLVHELRGFYWASRAAMAGEEAQTAHMTLGDRRKAERSETRS